MIQWMSGFILRSVNGVEKVIAEFDPRTEQVIASRKVISIQKTFTKDYSAPCSHLRITFLIFLLVVRLARDLENVTPQLYRLFFLRPATRGPTLDLRSPRRRTHLSIQRKYSPFTTIRVETDSRRGIPVLLRRVHLYLVANQDKALSIYYLFKSPTLHYIEIPWLSFIGSTYSPWHDQFDYIILSHRRYIVTYITKKRREKAKIRIYKDEMTEKAWFQHYQRKTEDWLADLDYYSMQGLDRIMVGSEAHSDKVMEDWAKIREGEEDFPEDFKIPRF